MNEETPEETAGPTLSSVAHSEGRSADQVSQRNTKSLSTWKKIGSCERVGEGLRLSFSDPFNENHVVFITRREVRRITEDRIPGDVCTIKETAGEIVTSNVGKAFRSRTGRAMCIRLPYFAGQDIMIPWNPFLKVMAGQQAKAIISIIDKPEPDREAQHRSTTSLSHGLQGCF